MFYWDGKWLVRHKYTVTMIFCINNIRICIIFFVHIIVSLTQNIIIVVYPCHKTYSQTREMTVRVGALFLILRCAINLVQNHTCPNTHTSPYKRDSSHSQYTPIGQPSQASWPLTFDAFLNPQLPINTSGRLTRSKL